MAASMTAAMASVAPQVTVISRSASTWIPYHSAYFAASAMRRPGVPQVIAYWLTSSCMARQAASLSSPGAGKSGKPCARLIAPCRLATRVMSRMTDSVKVWVRTAVRWLMSEA